MTALIDARTVAGPVVAASTGPGNASTTVKREQKIPLNGESNAFSHENVTAVLCYGKKKTAY